MASSSNKASHHDDAASSTTMTYPPVASASSNTDTAASSSSRALTTSTTSGSPRKVLRTMPGAFIHDDDELDLEAQNLAASIPLPPSRTPSRPSVDTAASSSSTTTPDVPATPTSAVTAAMTPAMRARVGLSRRLWTGVSAMRTRSRLFLICRGILAIAQVATLIVTLSLSSARGQTCGKPVQTYLAVYLVKTAITYPISFYNALAPPAQPPRGTTDTPAWRATAEASRVVGSPGLDSLLRSIADLLVIFAVVWFILGNVWTLNSSGLQCKDTAPLLFWSSIATLSLAYLRILEFVIIIIAIVFFLPAVIIFLRVTGNYEKKHEIGPLSKEEIAKLPVVVYVPAPPEVTTDDVDEKTSNASKAASSSPATPTGTQQVSASTAPSNAKGTYKKHSKLQRLFTGRKAKKAEGNTFGKTASHGGSSVYVATPYRQHPLPDNLSSCPICLCDFEPPPLLTASAEEQKEGLANLEQLNLLPCRHAIHKDCLAPWLQTSGRCPVCQQAILPDKQAEGKKGRQAAANPRTTGTPTVTGGANTTPAPATPPTAVSDAIATSQVESDSASPPADPAERSVVDRYE